MWESILAELLSYMVGIESEMFVAYGILFFSIITIPTFPYGVRMVMIGLRAEVLAGLGAGRPWAKLLEKVM